MIVDSTLDLDIQTLPNGKVPGYTQARVWLVNILDCTSKPHGVGDARTDADAGGVDDQGIGAGQIYVLTDPLLGNIIGWTWEPTLSKTIRQGTDSTKPNYAPMLAGYLSGPGIP